MRRRLIQVVLGIGISGGLLLLTSQSAYADNCGDLVDCFGTTGAAVVAAVAVAALVAAVVFGGAWVLAAAGEVIADVAAEGLAEGLGDLMAREAAEGLSELAEETVTTQSAIEDGLVKPGGKLANVLQGIEDAYASTPPQNLPQAMNIVQQITGGLGLGAGIAVDAAETVPQGYVEFVNVGNVVTRIFNSGEIIITKGSDVILHLFP